MRPVPLQECAEKLRKELWQARGLDHLHLRLNRRTLHELFAHCFPVEIGDNKTVMRVPYVEDESMPDGTYRFLPGLPPRSGPRKAYTVSKGAKRARCAMGVA